MWNKWTVTAGPRQSKKVLEVLHQFQTLAKTSKTLSGVIGVSERTSETWSPFGPDVTPKALEAYNLLGESFNWTITPENFQQVLVLAAAAAKEVSDKHLHVEDERITPEVYAENIRRSQEASEKYKAEQATGEAILNAVMAKRPVWADRLIVAEYVEDDSDSMTDYYNSKTIREVAIGWGKGKRENFNQLREAAASFEPTKDMGPGCDKYKVLIYRGPDNGPNEYRPCEHLRLYPGNEVCITSWPTEAEAKAAVEAVIAEDDALPFPKCVRVPFGYRIECESVENRENWSMGAGNYLSRTGRHGTGWKVKSYTLPCKWVNLTEDAIPTATARTASSPTQKTVTEIEVSENTEKGGIEIRFPEKPSPDVISSLKEHGWRWSRFSSCWWIKASESARAFAESLKGSLVLA